MISSNDFQLGEVYLATDLIRKLDVAVKLESDEAPCPQLEHEAAIYRLLRNTDGVPALRWFGAELGYNALVIDLLGQSLEEMFNFCKRRFSLKTVLLLADQMVCYDVVFMRMPPDPLHR